MARLPSTASRRTGALLAFACGFAFPVAAAPDEEGATSAAPIACTAEQFVLRSYVIALQSGDVTSGARDPERIARALTPPCRQAIDNGRWPGLAEELLAHASNDEAVKRAVCAIAPPEALAAITEWETAAEDARASYDVPCAVALLRHSPEAFSRVVGPRLGGAGGCAFPDLAARLGESVGPDERIKLLPTLDFATSTRAQGRDRLYQVLCQHPAARTQAVCQAPPALEPAWAHDARIARATWGIALHVGEALLFALAVALLRRFRGQRWPALAMSILASTATFAALAWIVASAPPLGVDASHVMGAWLAMVATLVAALAGGLLAWAVIRSARGAALAWCLSHALVYGVVTAIHAWTSAGDRLC